MHDRTGLPEKGREGGPFFIVRKRRERRARHEDLAAHLELGESAERAAEPGRNARDRPQIRGHVLADPAVAAGGADR